MKKKICLNHISVIKKLAASIVVSVFIITSIKAQPPSPQGAPVPPPPPPANGRNIAPPPPNQSLQQVAVYTGKVVKMNTNDDYVYNGFYMLNNGDSLLVKFPPHLGTQITGAIKTGSTVSVNGALNVAPMGEKEIRMVSITADGRTIMDTAVMNTTPPTENYISGNGKITQLQTNREGIISGLIIDNKTILHIPPQVINQLSSVVQLNTGVAYTGLKKAANNGEVSTADYAIVHCKTITIKGQQYLVQ